MNTENPYNIDMKSTEPQAMSEKRAGTAILAETLKDYFGALNFFAGSDQENLTYEDRRCAYRGRSFGIPL